MRDIFERGRLLAVLLIPADNRGLGWTQMVYERGGAVDEASWHADIDAL
jgi:hypothetical protein